MKLIHEAVKYYASVSPDRIAVQDSEGALTYKQLDETSSLFACDLEFEGIKKGDKVAVYVPLSKEFDLAVVSVMKCGAVFIPLDPEYPKSRMEQILEQSGAAAIMTVRSLWEKKKLNFPRDRVVFLDEAVLYGSGDTGFAVDGITPESPVMMLYTSGTTGKPKGIIHMHKMLPHLMDFMEAAGGMPMTEESRAAVITSFSFIVALGLILGPLCCGSTVCIAPWYARKDPAALAAFIKEQNITHVFIPSGMAAIMVENYDLSKVYVFTGGEKIRNFRPCKEGNTLVNLYGCTETGHLMAKELFGNEKSIAVGKPDKKTRIQIVDENLRSVAEGEPGELLISNEFMAGQYYELPDLSAEKWINIGGETWFRMGDRAVLNENGDIVILGRMDNMVKLRGFRVETGEVESQIQNALNKAENKDVTGIAVALRTVGGTDHLVCYYESENELDTKALTDEISQYLIYYMVPDIWVRMDSFPRNINGKIMRKELPRPKRTINTKGIIDSEVLARIVQSAAEILDTDSYISPDDRFTETGGTSLAAMQLSVRLSEQGIRISPAKILQLGSYRKIAESADVSYEQLWTQDEYGRVISSFADKGINIQKVLPLSAKQDEMLFERLIHPDLADDTDVICLQTDSIVSEKDLREILDVIAAEHEELRASVVYHNISVIQQVITDRKIPLTVTEENNFDGEKMEALRKSLLFEDRDMQYGSMMKLVCVHTECGSYLYVISRRITVGKKLLRHAISRMMELLFEKYPKDAAIIGWKEILDMDLAAKSSEKEGGKDAAAVSAAPGKIPPEIFIYSENKGPKVVFVHSGNTGSEAYYRLAERIRNDVSFAVIEQFNMYHPDKACYGIKNVASNYIRILKEYQPQGPYILGGWCYGGIVAHEMACQLQAAGESVTDIFMLDSHIYGDDEKLKDMSLGMMSGMNRDYFETSPAFAHLIAGGMLDAMLSNADHVKEDILNHVPSVYEGNVVYFKASRIPEGSEGGNYKYWKNMMGFKAGNFEKYCRPEKLKVIPVPFDHDRIVAEDEALDIIAPEILKAAYK